MATVDPKRVIRLRLMGHTFQYIASMVGISAPRAYQICVESRRKDLRVKMGKKYLTKREKEIISTIFHGRLAQEGNKKPWTRLALELNIKSGSSCQTAWRRAAAKAGIDYKVAME